MADDLKKLLKDSTSRMIHSFYEDSYKKAGFNAQRRYPNEEFCRFMGRNFSPIAPEQRKKLRF